MQCPVCHANLKEDAKFCLKCGQKIPRCPTCGEVVRGRSKFCSRDGTRLPEELLEVFTETPGAEPSKSEKPVSQPPVTPPPVSRPPVTGQPVSQPLVTEPAKKKFCAKCGSVSADGQPICRECRAKAAAARSSSAARRREPEKKDSSKLIVILIIAGAVVLSLLLIFAGYTAITGSFPFAKEEPGEVRAEDMQTFDDWQILQDDETVAPPMEESEPVVILPAETVAPTEVPTEPPTQPPTEPEIDEDERVLYFLEYCDSRYLSSGDIEGFDEEMCRIARNGIYAKSGRKFKDSALQEYYEQYDWYEPRIDPSNFTASMLNDYQNANLNLIMNYEREHGYR